MEKVLKNKKGQLDNPIISFVAFMVLLFLIAPAIVLIGTSVMGGFAKGVDSIDDTNKTAEQVGSVENTFTNWIDIIIIGLFFVLVVVMFVSSYLIDVSPFFIILYIVSIVVFFLIGGGLIDGVVKVWSADKFSDVAGYMPMTQFIISNFFIVMLGLIVITGIIIYAKLRGNYG